MEWKRVRKREKQRERKKESDCVGEEHRIYVERQQLCEYRSKDPFCSWDLINFDTHKKLEEYFSNIKRIGGA